MKAWFNDFFASAKDEWRTITVTDRPLLLVLLMIPMFYPFVVSYLYRSDQPSERPVVVVDEDHSELSRQLIFDLDASHDVAVVSRDGSYEDGYSAIKSQDADMMVYIPEDFSSTIKRGEQADVKIYVNTANMLTYSFVYSAISNVVATMNEKLGLDYFQSKGLATPLAEGRVMPVIREERLLYFPSIAYGGFLIPGVLLLVMQQVVLISVAFSVGLRNEKKSYLRVARPLAVAFGRVLTQFIFYLFGIAFIFAVIIPNFSWPIVKMAPAILLFVFFVMAVAPLAVFLARFMSDRYASFQFLMFVSMPLFMMSGFTWPLSQMPGWIQAIASLMPATPALLALRVLSMKSGNLSDVSPYLLWLFGLALLYLAIAWIASRDGFGRSKQVPAESPNTAE